MIHGTLFLFLADTTLSSGIPKSVTSMRFDRLEKNKLLISENSGDVHIFEIGKEKSAGSADKNMNCLLGHVSIVTDMVKIVCLVVLNFTFSAFILIISMFSRAIKMKRLESHFIHDAMILVHTC